MVKSKVIRNRSGELHPRNLHHGRYDLPLLVESYPKLAEFVAENKYGDLSVDFFNPEAVKALNSALLYHFYGIEYWDIPHNALVPPIPSRADYINYVADLVPRGKEVRCLDIGVGANCIYPILGVGQYGWNFVGSDIDQSSIASAQKIVSGNKKLQGKVELRLQSNRDSIFEGIIQKGDYFDLTICNPPFHDSPKSAQMGSERKMRNLKGGTASSYKVLNFAGNANELWCKGGELAFISNMISQSLGFRSQCRWFTTLVSKEDNLGKLIRVIQGVEAKEYRILEMCQGNKRSRVLAWRF